MNTDICYSTQSRYSSAAHSSTMAKLKTNPPPIVLLMMVLVFLCARVESANCSADLENLNAAYNTLNDSYVACGCGVDPCASLEVIVYNQGLHIGAIFIVLAASVIGAGVPLLAKYSPVFRIPPYVICLGKCMGIGVVLACALVHMIQPASASLTSPCVPWEFNTDYNAYAFLFAMLAGLVMQFIDFCLLEFVTATLKKGSNSEEMAAPEEGEDCGHSHPHSILLEAGMEKRISAYMLEFGVAVHSVFIGLENGVVDEQTLKTLLVALCFHQFFEGVALGARIADANMPSHWQEFLLATIFSIAAPIGIMVGVIVTSTLNPNGESFLLIQGTFDGVCGGILLYIGFVLLLKDFPADMKKHCNDSPYRDYMRAGMFLSLWTGAGVMAYIGKYL